MASSVQDALEALAHPGRRRLLQFLMDQERQAGELAVLAGMSQPGTSQHLRVLREAGLVTVRHDGPRRIYRVDFKGLQALRSELNDFWGKHLTELQRVTRKRR